MLLVFWITSGAPGAEPQAILNVLPTPEALGPNWERNISMFFDPLSKPPEIIATVSPMPESFKQEKREGVANPQSAVSGWGHALYMLQRANGVIAYDVHIDRYRKRERLTEDFHEMLQVDSEQYRKIPLKALGEEAMFCWNAQGPGSTVWFRRADFKVWINPVAGSITNWNQDASLQRLAAVLDQTILRASGDPSPPAPAR